MRRIVSIAVLSITVAFSLPHAGLIAAQAAQAPASSIKVCGLLPRAEVKKLIGGDKVFDMMAPEEEAIGTYGSSCNYPGVLVQVIPFNQATIENARKRGKLDDLAGIGDAAYSYDNPAGYAEIYVKVGTRLLTIQRDVPMGQTQADVRPGAIALARTLVAKLR